MNKKWLLPRICLFWIFLPSRLVESFSSIPLRGTVDGMPRTRLATSASRGSETAGENRKKEKRLVLIRHGSSHMNEYIGDGGIAFGGPGFTDVFEPGDRETRYRDSPLSATGRDQAKRLGERMWIEECGGSRGPEGSRAVLEDLELIVVSPLTRAIQTAELALFPRVSAAIPAIALPLAAERLYLVSDVGRPRRDLESKYGERVDFQTGFPQATDDDDAWWYRSESRTSPEWRPMGQGQAYFCPGEPYDDFRDRMRELCGWLVDREESVIALVGHYGVFEWLLQEEGEEEKVKFLNCELRVVPFDAILANANRRRNPK